MWEKTTGFEKDEYVSFKKFGMEFFIKVSVIWFFHVEQSSTAIHVLNFLFEHHWWRQTIFRRLHGLWEVPVNMALSSLYLYIFVTPFLYWLVISIFKMSLIPGSIHRLLRLCEMQCHLHTCALMNDLQRGQIVQIHEKH